MNVLDSVASDIGDEIEPQLLVGRSSADCEAALRIEVEDWKERSPHPSWLPLRYQPRLQDENWHYLLHLSLGMMQEEGQRMNPVGIFQLE